MQAVTMVREEGEGDGVMCATQGKLPFFSPNLTYFSISTVGNNFFFPLKAFMVSSVHFYFLSSWSNSSEKQTPTILCPMKKFRRALLRLYKGHVVLHRYSRASRIPTLRAIRTPKVTRFPSISEPSEQGHIAMTPSWRSS